MTAIPIYRKDANNLSLANFLRHCNSFVWVRLYSENDLEKPINNYDNPSHLLLCLDDEILNQQVKFFGSERAEPNKDNTIVVYVILKEEQQ